MFVAVKFSLFQDRQSKEKSMSPQENNKPKEATECGKDRDAVSEQFDFYSQ